MLQTLCLIALSSLAGLEPDIEWTASFKAMPHSPTLFSSAAGGAADRIAVAAGNELAVLDGAGKDVWRVDAGASLAASPTVADLDGDGAPEVFALRSDGIALCYDAGGAQRWQIKLGPSAESFALAAAADVHSAPGLEIVVGIPGGWLYCLDARGNVLWRFFGDAFRLGACAAGDVNGDGFAEIVYGTDNANLYCLDGFGRIVWRASDGNAPFGRSGVNLADLDGDGSVEVLLTRSNQGNANCLAAFDGATGALEWRSPTLMQGYISNATVDLDGDGKLETLHGNKGNFVHCTNADGSERWRAEMAGHGIFWAPAVADVNGDGAPEMVAGMRGVDSKTGATHVLLSATGEVLAAFKLGGNGNGGPAAGDVDGDGEIEVLAPVGNPDTLQCLTWHGKGAVAWSGLRGGAAMTGRGNAPAGAPRKALEKREAPAIALETDPVYLGENTLQVSWDAPAPKEAFLTLTLRAKHGPNEVKVYPVRENATSATCVWNMPARGNNVLEASLHASGQPSCSALAFARAAATTRPPVECGFEEVRAACAAASSAATTSGADAAGLRARLVALDAQRREVAALAKQNSDDAALAAAATALRGVATELKTAAASLEALWKTGDKGDFVAWPDANPWDDFDPVAAPEALEAAPPVCFTACVNEFEDAALNLMNTGTNAVDVRCTFAKPDLSGKPVPPLPDLAKHIALRRGVRIPGNRGEMKLDALPELDDSQTITLAPFEAQQLWLVADTYGLEPGIHEITLYIGSIEQHNTFRAIPVRIEVLPVTLPIGVYAQINWTGIDRDQSSDQQLKDMIDHGITVGYGPPLPAIPLDAEGNVSGAADWTRVDEGLARVPGYFQCLWSGPPAMAWPKDAPAPAEDSPQYQKGYAAALAEMVTHLAARGWGYDRWAFYPMDEPWLNGLANIPPLRAFCEKVKHADPQARIYADPTGLLRVEYVSEFKDLIDVWQPEMNMLKRDLGLRQWFQENAHVFWAYEATDPAKELLPLGYYRLYPWTAWLMGTVGAGFWCYKDFDTWWPLTTSTWSVVYPNGDRVVPSRRWEALRDGQEDYRLFYALREAILKAGKDTPRAQAAQQQLDQAVEEVVGWQARSIDEITRQTRDYEADYAAILKWKRELAKTASELDAK